MTNAEAVNWLINIAADMGKIEHQGLWHYEQALTEIKEMLETEPQRIRGHWIDVSDNYNRISGICSVCGWEAHMYEDDVVGMDYCPNCGAWMGGQDENR